MIAASPLAAQQLAPPSTGGIAALDLALSRLATNKRVLVIGAHPDDENSELLTLLSRGMGADAAYLSLSRGEGGQNLIGAELGEALGLIRSGELVAARSVDGGRQFFTRAFDFGFSKTLAETLHFWPRDTILGDVLRVIRRFQPQILVTIFRGNERDGHGQHQMSAVMGQQAFAVLRDSAWGPAKLYRSTAFDTSGAPLRIRSGMLDPVSGRSITQIAAHSRSQHRSQDMGQIQRLGTSEVRLQLLQAREAREATEAGLFAGVDTSLERGLERYAMLIDSARANLTARGPARIVPVLCEALGELRRHASADFRARKEDLLQQAIATAAGIFIDVTTDDAQVVPGQQINAGISVWNAGPVAARVLSRELSAPPGWVVRAGPDTTLAGGVPQARFTVTVAPGAEPSTPYFMRRPRRDGLYDWSGVADSLRGEPFEDPPLHGVVRLAIGGTELVLRREASWRFNDQAFGEIRKPLAVVPIVGVTVSPSVLLWTSGSTRSRQVMVELVHGARSSTSGELGLELPDGWAAVPSQRFQLDGEGARKAFVFQVTAPRTARSGSFIIHPRALINEAGSSGAATTIIDYPHIRPVATTHPAQLRVEVAPLVLPRVAMIGYVRGASDMVPEALASAGLPVEVIGGEALERADLSRYSAIVIGSRAYETDQALVAANARLLDWVRDGGKLIVQYQQYQFVQSGFAPLRLTIHRPHDRVTDESAPVTPLDPSHALFTRPNRMTAQDWDGWVQERGLYFAREWDPAYRPLLEMGDAGERLRGGLLAAPVGRGLYIYTGLSFFRQLPAAVPGAFRLFMNLLALEASDVR